MKARQSLVEQPDFFNPADERWAKFSDQTKTAVLELVATLLRQMVSSQTQEPQTGGQPCQVKSHANI
jgi:hypothetical protein